MIAYLFRLSITCVGTLLLLINDSGATTIGASPINIVNKSETIVIGRFVGNSESPNFFIEEALKGDIKVGIAIGVEFPPVGFMFDKIGLLKKIGNSRTILLGNYDTSKKILILNYSYLGVWPQGLPNKFLLESNISSYKSFILGIRAYKNAGNNTDELIKALVEDDIQIRPYAVLDYADRELGKHLAGRGSTVRNQVLTILFVKLTSKKLQDPNLVEKLISISPNVPISLSIPWLLAIADSTLETASRAFSMAKSRLKARRMISADADMGEVKQTFNAKKNILRRGDAKKALKMFESEYSSIKRSANLVSKKIVGNIKKDLGAMDEEMQKEYWQKQIELLSK